MGAERWERLWRRIDLMRLPLLRVIVPVSTFAPEGRARFNTPAMEALQRVLAEAGARGMAVIWGIDSEGMIFDGKSDPDLHEAFADATAHLILERGHACIRYLNLFDAPNQGRSFRAGSPEHNYALWADAMRAADELLVERGITHDRARLIGPCNDGHHWHLHAADDLGDLLGGVAVHAHPRDALVRGCQLESAWRAARQQMTDRDQMHTPLILSACGLGDDVGEDDRQWHVRKVWYAVAMADLAAQALRAGLAGAIYRTLDDAMAPRSLWGLWDSTSAYDRDGEPRPVARAWALLSRCFPPAAQTVATEHDAPEGVRAAAARIDGKAEAGEGWSILLVNRRPEPLEVMIQFPAPACGLCRFDCFESACPTDYEGFPIPAATDLSTDPAGRLDLHLPANGMMVISSISS